MCCGFTVIMYYRLSTWIYLNILSQATETENMPCCWWGKLSRQTDGACDCLCQLEYWEFENLPKYFHKGDTQSIRMAYMPDYML